MIHLILGLAVGFAVLAITLRKILFSVFSLALVSVFLSLSFYQLGAPVAGVFELSVGAGLITVLMVLTLTFIQKRKEEKIVFPALWIILSLVICGGIFVIFYLLSAGTGEEAAGSISGSWKETGEMIWKQRVADLFPQALIIVSAVLGIIALLRKKTTTP